MKQLKVGTLVFHKLYKRGIIAKAIDQSKYGILFQNLECGLVCHREALFTRGDEISFKTKGGIWRRGVFHDWMDHNPKNDTKFTVYVKKMIQGREMRTLSYAINVTREHRQRDLHTEEVPKSTFGSKMVDASAVEKAIAAMQKVSIPNFPHGGVVSSTHLTGDTVVANIELPTKEQMVRDLEDAAKNIDTTKEGKYGLIERLRVLELKAKLDALLEELK